MSELTPEAAAEDAGAETEKKELDLTIDASGDKPAEEAPTEESVDELLESTSVVDAPALAPPAEAEASDNYIRKETPHPAEASLVEAGETRISRALLEEIDQRRAVGDIATLLAACRSLLDELEASEGRS